VTKTERKDALVYRFVRDINAPVQEVNMLFFSYTPSFPLENRTTHPIISCGDFLKNDSILFFLKFFEKPM